MICSISGEATLSFCFLLPSQWETTLKGKNLLLKEYKSKFFSLTLLHSEQPKLHRVLAVLSAIGLKVDPFSKGFVEQGSKLGVTKIIPLGKDGLKRCLLHPFSPGRVAQAVGHLTSKSEVLGSIPGLAT